jgi:heme-degrading monooxygenase HmoA
MAGMAGAAAALAQAQTGNAIQLHVDLEVDPAKEKEMLANFRRVFQPAIRKQPGFVEVKLLKFREAMVGSPGAFNYRLLISFRTEEQRKAWVAHDDHQRAWPTIESCLKGAKYRPWLYDIAG